MMWALELYNSQNANQIFLADISRFAQNVKINAKLNNVSSLSFSIDIEAWKEYCELAGIDVKTTFKPLTNEIKVRYAGQYLPHAFEIQEAQKDYNEDSKTLSVEAEDTGIKLSRRITFQTFNRVDSAKIARDMITYTQNKQYGDLGIQFGDNFMTNTPTDRQEWNETGKVILDAIRELSDDVSGGFDFYFDHDRKYYSSAFRGSTKQLRFTYGSDTSNVISMKVPDDGTIIANSVYIVGNGIGDPIVSEPHTDSNSAIIYGLCEKVLSYSDASLDRANQISEREVRDRKEGYYLPDITVSEEVFNPKLAYLGDIVDFECKEPMSLFEGKGRIKAITISLSNDFYATFDLELLKVE